jgi:hypothetical protein
VIGPPDGEIVVAPGMKHSLASVSGDEAHLRCVAIPALGLQSFLEQTTRRGARWAARFLKRHRADVVMSFPPRPLQSALIASLGRSQG